jgi:hypothetical protein
MSRLGDAHMNGDCWPSLCTICEIEDALAEDDASEDEQ